MSLALFARDYMTRYRACANSEMPAQRARSPVSMAENELLKRQGGEGAPPAQD